MVNKINNYNLDINKIYHSDNYGPYIVIETYKSATYKKGPSVLIEFICTKNRVITDVSKALNGEVRDPKLCNKIPIDTILLSEEDRYKRLDRLAKEMWRSMIRRCYDPNTDNFQSYGGIGISICDRWMNRDLFLKDIANIFQYNKWYRFPTIYQLDKDYLQLNIQKDKRIYSPETCVFLHASDNKNLRVIEFKRDNQCISKYYGVTKETANTYSASLSLGKGSMYLRAFSSEIAAANAFNYWQLYLHRYDIIPLLNEVPYMPPSEFIKYNTRPKEICTIKRERLKL